MFETLLRPMHLLLISRACAAVVRAQKTAGVRQRPWRRYPQIQIGNEEHGDSFGSEDQNSEVMGQTSQHINERLSK